MNDREEVVITRRGTEPVVMVRFADFESLRETAYLFAIAGQRPSALGRDGATGSGRGQERGLLDEDEEARLG